MYPFELYSLRHSKFEKEFKSILGFCISLFCWGEGISELKKIILHSMSHRFQAFLAVVQALLSLLALLALLLPWLLRLKT